MGRTIHNLWNTSAIPTTVHMIFSCLWICELRALKPRKWFRTLQRRILSTCTGPHVSSWRITRLQDAICDQVTCSVLELFLVMWATARARAKTTVLCWSKAGEAHKRFAWLMAVNAHFCKMGTQL